LNLRVKLYGTLRRFSEPGAPGLWTGDVPTGARLEDLIRLIGATTAEVAGASIDGELYPFDAEIPPGTEEITLVTPMGGG